MSNFSHGHDLAPYEGERDGQRWNAVGTALVVSLPMVMADRGLDYAGNIDLSPTFADYASASSGWTNMDGRSLRPLLEGNAVPAWRQRLLVEHWFDPNGPIFNDLPDLAQVRTSSTEALPNQSYIEYYGTTGKLNQSSSAVEQELYDVPNDPSEAQAVTTAPTYATERATLSTEVQALRLCAADTCRAAENAP